MNCFTLAERVEIIKKKLLKFRFHREHSLNLTHEPEEKKIPRRPRNVDSTHIS